MFAKTYQALKQFTNVCWLMWFYLTSAYWSSRLEPVNNTPIQKLLYIQPVLSYGLLRASTILLKQQDSARFQLSQVSWYSVQPLSTKISLLYSNSSFHLQRQAVLCLHLLFDLELALLQLKLYMHSLNNAQKAHSFQRQFIQDSIKTQIPSNHSLSRYRIHQHLHRQFNANNYIDFPLLIHSNPLANTSTVTSNKVVSYPIPRLNEQFFEKTQKSEKSYSKIRTLREIKESESNCKQRVLGRRGGNWMSSKKLVVTVAKAKGRLSERKGFVFYADEAENQGWEEGHKKIKLTKYMEQKTARAGHRR